MKFGEIENLYARFGTASPNLCFAGHTDGRARGRSGGLVEGRLRRGEVDGVLIGRGLGGHEVAIAAFAAAAAEAIAAGTVTGSLSFPHHRRRGGRCDRRHHPRGRAPSGRGRGHRPLSWSANPPRRRRFGDMVKVGRRGSINADIVVEGTSGHVAYRTARPIPCRC
jgi:succinyl-diaminopimelate desuccinylase